jgi:hypothetical protein
METVRQRLIFRLADEQMAEPLAWSQKRLLENPQEHDSCV